MKQPHTYKIVATRGSIYTIEGSDFDISDNGVLKIFSSRGVPTAGIFTPAVVCIAAFAAGEWSDIHLVGTNKEE